MSRRLFDLNPELKRLRDEGYNVTIRNGFLIMYDVPYVTSSREVKRAFLATPLLLSNDRTQPPDSHTMHWSGEYPCDQNGKPIERIRNQNQIIKIDDNHSTLFTFSAKPQPSGRYPDNYTKVTTYAAILAGPAARLQEGSSPKTFPHVADDDEHSVFRYVDSASSRAEITAITKKLEGHRIGIVGLGGTGGYVLDFLAKTPVAEIRLIDGDIFYQHNAFRAPGAATGEELNERMSKVEYFRRKYDPMRRGIIAIPDYLTADNLKMLDGLNFVFLCMEGGDKPVIVKKLEELNISFIDVGMGLYPADGALGGLLRVTTSTPEKREHVWGKRRIPFAQNMDRNEYDQNIQIADLNALNAALAVIRWKRLCGFYIDQENEHFSTYVIGGNDISNEDK